ncbi:MAG: Type 1 glutamine amidotransferase-like domain-containing protein [Acidimicrobiales bacterium]|nr:Type 1 glutamine amidotransferase-like domain-containing protein [Acidimicrobiales bacterium]
MTGPLALVGGEAFTEGCTFDAELLAASGGTEVVVLPTAAAYEHPDREVAAATTWFEGLGASVRGLDVLRRPDALLQEHVDAVAAARFVYVTGGSSMHLRSVFKDSPVWDALVAAWEGGAVLAASSGAARVLCDPMVDPRGGAFAVGLGLLPGLAIIPHHDHWSREKAHRTIQLAPRGLPIAGIDDRTALIRDPDGTWRIAGAGEVAVFVDGQPQVLSVLP